MTHTTGPARKVRHDAFDGDRKRRFLKALGKCACVRDAARTAGVSPQTVYSHQRSDPHFARQCELALDKAGTDIELHAWERGVVGIEEPIWRGGEIVGTRVKRSDNILRLLLQGANRKKYGPNPGFSRKTLAKAERKRIRDEVRAEYHEKRRVRPIEEVQASILEKLARIDEHEAPQRLAEGWTRAEDGHWIPPGWVRAPGWAVLAEPDGRGGSELDSV